MYAQDALALFTYTHILSISEGENEKQEINNYFVQAVLEYHQQVSCDSLHRRFLFKHKHNIYR